MAEDLMVVLKRSENASFGFSLLGTAGFPHVIYDIVENSPAADCGQVEAGDVIVKVNGTDVHAFTTKDVLKCLRLSTDPVTLELKRDPKIKAHVRKYLASISNQQNHHSNPSSPLSERTTSSSSVLNSPGRSFIGRTIPTSFSDSQCRPSRIPQAKQPKNAWSQSPQHGAKQPRPSMIPTANGQNHNLAPQQIAPPSTQQHQQQQQQQQQKPNKARFEAYMMTGDKILNLSRTPQSSSLIPQHAKKIDSLRDSPSHRPSSAVNNSNKRKNGAVAPYAKCDSSPSSASNSSDENNDNSVESVKRSFLVDNINNHKNTKNTSNNHNHNNNNNINNSDLIMNDKLTDLNDVKSRRTKSKSKNLNSGCVKNFPYDERDEDYEDDDVDLEDDEELDDDNVHLIENEENDELASEDLVDCIKGTTMTNNQKDLDLKQDLNELKVTSSSSSTTVKSEEISYSVPTSPTSLLTPLIEGYSASLKKKELANSVPTSPESGTQDIIRRSTSSNHHHPSHHLHSSQQNGSSNGSNSSNCVVRKCDAAGFRTSRSEDHLQQAQRDGGIGAVVPIDIDEDVNSSLNTLLDTRHDSEESQSSDQDRIVWTYNAPVAQTSGVITSPISHSSSISSSPQRTGTDNSPASPTSVSSSVMSSNGSKAQDLSTYGNGMSNMHSLMCPVNGEHSVSEAVSNLSSPDYQDEHDLLSSRDMASIALSDPSDSDSTIMVSETTHRIHERSDHRDRDHRLLIQVNRPLDGRGHYSELKDSEDELATITEDMPTVFVCQESGRESSPVSDDGSDVDSLHSFHYSPKAVDLPSAERLAKRLFYLEGFKKSDVSRHLSKNNDFSRAVADEYLKFFAFERLTLDEALRLFLKQFSLSGETQERERVLVHFSKRYLDCNPGTFNSQDAVHTLTCAIMLLNTDLHGPNIGRKMTCSEFIENLSELNDGENFPKDVLKQLYNAIKSQPLEWALDDESPDQQKPARSEGSLQGPPVGPNPFLEAPQTIAAIEYKKGYVMRKCCYDTNYKKTPFGKRSWKMFYCTLRDLVLYLHKDEHGFRKNQMSDNVHNAIRIHHGLATKASDYTKKQHVFRLQTADQSEFLFQTSDSKELQSWIDTINFVCASFSAPPLEGAVGSQKRFQRPLLPCTHTKLMLRDQLASHEDQVQKLENLLTEHKSSSIPTKGLALQNYKEKETYIIYELKRYKTYVYLLSSRMNSTDQTLDFDSLLENSIQNSDNSEELMLKNRQNQSATTTYSLSQTTYNSAGATQTTLIQPQPQLTANRNERKFKGKS